MLIHGTNRARGEAMLQELGEAAALHLDPLDDPSSPARIVAAALAAFGSLHAVVNNAASVPKSVLESVTVESFEQTMAVNTLAPLLLTQAALPALKQTQGCILNIGWDQADRGMEGDSGELFATAKNAVMGFTRSLAVSLAPQVRVNCIAPGWIRTAWGEQAGDQWQQRVITETPLRCWGTPEDIAKLARFLLSDEASYITGQVINANGGAVR